MPEPAQADVQARVLAVYTTLCALKTDLKPGGQHTWEGGLILGLGLGPVGAALAMAANLAGAVSLSIDPDPALCRAALRSGACDFAVNSLDEAVRVMKNEVRKRAPLSVALESPIEATMAELVERGMLPELFAGFPDAETEQQTGSFWLADATAVFSQQGTLVVDLSDTTERKAATAIDGPAFLAQYLLARELVMREFPFLTGAELRSFDAHAAKLLTEDRIRHRWATGAPRAFYRERPCRRLLYLSRHEFEALVATAAR